MARKTGTVHGLQGAGIVRKALQVSALLPIAVFFLLLFIMCHSAQCADTWPGVDESVVEKFASERGREAHEPLVNTDQGDLLLFVFLLAGTIGGFAAGYSWRMLLEGKTMDTECTILKKK